MSSLRRVSPSMVVAFIALGVSLSGTGYALTKLARNSVGTKQLKANAVTSAKVKNGALKRADFATGTLLQGPQGATGATGAAGATGPAGANGAAGAPALVKTTQLKNTSGQVTDNSVALAAFEQIKAIGTFTKTAASTGILVRANITTSAPDNAACQFQLRVDGATVTGSTSADPTVSGTDASSAIRSNSGATINVVPMTLDGDFGTLAAGDHVVSIWMRGNGANCTIDPINFQQERALVEEYSK